MKIIKAMEESWGDAVERDFKYHPPKEGQAKRYEAIRNKAKELALMLVRECPDSSEKNLALTKIEEAVMWANASIARNEA
jgi:hypothetical protein